MNKLLRFDDDDRKLWLGIFVIGTAGIIILSLFTSTSFLGFSAAITVAGTAFGIKYYLNRKEAASR